MMQQTGEFCEQVVNVVKKWCCEMQFGRGSSGGVWTRIFNGEIVANGVHIVSDAEYKSWSLYFTRSILPDID